MGRFVRMKPADVEFGQDVTGHKARFTCECGQTRFNISEMAEWQECDVCHRIYRVRTITYVQQYRVGKKE